MALRVFSALCGELEFSFVFALVFLFFWKRARKFAMLSSLLRSSFLKSEFLFFYRLERFCLRFIFFALSLLFSSICKWRE